MTNKTLRLKKPVATGNASKGSQKLRLQKPEEYTKRLGKKRQ